MGKCSRGTDVFTTGTLGNILFHTPEVAVIKPPKISTRSLEYWWLRFVLGGQKSALGKWQPFLKGKIGADKPCLNFSQVVRYLSSGSILLYF